MAEQSIYINNSEVMTITDNNYTSTIIQAVTGPQGIQGPEGPPGPAGPRGPRGRSAPFYPKIVYPSYSISLTSQHNVIPTTNYTWLKLSSSSIVYLDNLENGIDGEMKILTNIGNNNIIINSFSILTHTGSNLTLSPKLSINVIYDKDANKWRTLSSNIGG